MSTEEPNAPVELRRQLFGDPEYPFWTAHPSKGHVIAVSGKLSVIVSVHKTALTVRHLDDEGNDSLEAKTLLFATEGKKVKVFDRLYFHGEDKPFQLNLIDNEPLYGYKPLNYESKLPENNPLRNMPFWGAPGGKNLTIISTLEWARLHLESENPKLPCKENEITLDLLYKCIELQKLRQTLRKQQNVLGTDKPHVAEKYMIDSIAPDAFMIGYHARQQDMAFVAYGRGKLPQYNDAVGEANQDDKCLELASGREQFRKTHNLD